jgi:ATP-dependent Clp protease adaptor protein ClpS
MTTTATPTKPKDKVKPKYQPQYAVVVINDDVHTFNYVINCFVKVFAYDFQKCLALAKTIHETGRAVVWTGSLEVAELKKEQIESMGPDLWAATPCNFPLKVDLEPLAE